jgi:hypothetical protein
MRELDPTISRDDLSIRRPQMWFVLNCSTSVASDDDRAWIKPDRVLNDLGRKAMSAVTEWSHADILPDAPVAPTRFP